MANECVRPLTLTPFLLPASADLVSATNTTNVNIPQMADTLFERSTNASWVVVFKALVTTHHMCVHGNEVRRLQAPFHVESDQTLDAQQGFYK